MAAAPPSSNSILEAYLQSCVQKGWTSYDLADKVFHEHRDKFGLSFAVSLASNCLCSLPRDAWLLSYVSTAIEKAMAEEKPGENSPMINLVNWIASGQSKLGFVSLAEYQRMPTGRLKIVIECDWADQNIAPDRSAEALARARQEVRAALNSDCEFYLKLEFVHYENAFQPWLEGDH